MKCMVRSITVIHHKWYRNC